MESRSTRCWCLPSCCVWVWTGPILPPAEAQNQNPLTERAYQDREILYEFQSPASHAFRITHDYTVRKVGEKYYFNVVRAGSHVTDPDSIDLDTGEKFKWETITGKQAAERKLPVSDTLKDRRRYRADLSRALN